MNARLHDYQRRCVSWLLNHDEALLFLGMGLGKTAVVLTALSDLKLLGELGRVLVIAPLAVARTTWPEEHETWAPDLTMSVAVGSRKEREAAIRSDVDVTVVNRENTCWLCDQVARDEWPWQTVVIDELSGFKNRQSKRFRALISRRHEMRRVWGLTGTPAPNGLIDLWAQVRLVDGGERLGRRITRYRQTYFRPGRGNGHVVYEWIPRDGAVEQVRGLLSDIAVSMRASDYLDLPDMVEHDVPVVLSDTQMRDYRRFQRDRVAELGDGQVTAASAAAVSGKLAQWAGGAVYDDDGTWRQTHRAKLDALSRVIDDAQGAPVLVFYRYVHDLERITKQYPHAVVLHAGEPETVKRWSAGEIGLLLAHPASCGYGLNLQRGGHIACWYSLTWDLAEYQQACARLHRQGQTEPVIVHRLVTRGTVDERILRVLAGKASLQDEILSMRGECAE